jgi:hypothetical protein
VTAAFEGFLTRDLGNDRDGFLVVEVFNVPEDRMEEVLRAGEALALEHLMKGGGFVTFSLWSPEETQGYFPQDVATVRTQRFANLVLEETLARWVSSPGSEPQHTVLENIEASQGWAYFSEPTRWDEPASAPRPVSEGSVTSDCLGLAA